MRRRSSKWQRIVREFGPKRAEYVNGRSCPIKGFPACECHEMAAGSHREKAYQERCAWLAVCRTGHEYIQGECYPKQLWFKLIQDIEGFDLKRFCTVVLGRAETAVTGEDIAEYGAAAPSRVRDLKGRRYGRLIVVGFCEKNARRQSSWYCVCDCGRAKTVLGCSLTGGHTQSCGCYHREQIAEVNHSRACHGHCVNGGGGA